MVSVLVRAAELTNNGISKYDWYWKISACSTEYEVCDSFASLTRQQASYSGSAGWYFRYQSIHFQITYTYRGGQFYWRKPEYPEITTELRQVTDKLYHRIWYTSPWAWVELTTSVMIGTDLWVISLIAGQHIPCHNIMAMLITFNFLLTFS